jgi:DNA-binding IclR family transcriptional regulator
MRNSADEPRPAAVFRKGHDIFNSICLGHSTLAAIEDATGYPRTTIIRIAALLVEDNIVTASRIDGELRLTMTWRGPSQGFD